MKDIIVPMIVVMFILMVIIAIIAFIFIQTSEKIEIIDKRKRDTARDINLYVYKAKILKTDEEIEFVGKDEEDYEIGDKIFISYKNMV